MSSEDVSSCHTDLWRDKASSLVSTCPVSALYLSLILLQSLHRPVFLLFSHIPISLSLSSLPAFSLHLPSSLFIFCSLGLSWLLSASFLSSSPFSTSLHFLMFLFSVHHSDIEVMIYRKRIVVTQGKAGHWAPLSHCNAQREPRETGAPRPHCEGYYCREVGVPV